MRATMMLDPLHNLRGFLANKPPLVIFTACLAVFAVGFLFVANYVLAVPLKDPDALDWNDVMEQLILSDLCVSAVQLGGSKGSAKDSEGFASWGRRRVSVGSLFAVRERNLEDPKFSMSFDLKLGEGVRRLAKGTEILWGRVDLEDLGLKTTRNEKQLKVSFDLGAKHGLVNCTSDDFCSVDPYVCVTFQGPIHALPRLREWRQCASRTPSRYDVSFSLVDSDESESCPGVPVALDYERDASLTVNLNHSEQMLMHRHLTYTSYFLFVMVITVLGFAACKSHSPSRVTGGCGGGGGGGGAGIERNGANAALLSEKLVN